MKKASATGPSLPPPPSTARFLSASSANNSLSYSAQIGESPQLRFLDLQADASSTGVNLENVKEGCKQTIDSINDLIEKFTCKREALQNDSSESDARVAKRLINEISSYINELTEKKNIFDAHTACLDKETRQVEQGKLNQISNLVKSYNKHIISPFTVRWQSVNQ